jgi:hypothetical protein
LAREKVLKYLTFCGNCAIITKENQERGKHMAKQKFDDGIGTIPELDIATDTLETVVDRPEHSSRATWANASNEHPVGLAIDKTLGSGWVSMTTKELIPALGYQFDIEDILDFNELSGVKKLKQQIQDKLNNLNTEASVARELQEGQDLSKIKKAKEITNEGVDDNIKFIYGFVPSSVIPVDIKNLSHTCSNCGFEEIIPLILEEGGENNE